MGTEHKERKKRPLIIRILLGICAAMLVIAALVFGFFGYLTIVEYTPEDVEDIAVSDGTGTMLKPGEEIDLISWNIGYCGLSAQEDFFMDGGSRSLPHSKAQVETNVEAVTSYLAGEDPDVVFLQEVDRDSNRSFHIDQVNAVEEALPGRDVSFANNYVVAFIPYPIPPLGSMDAGILTGTTYHVTSATRIQLPCPFSWPLRLGNLKRCLLVSRLPIEGTEQELVLVNLHLEAYDDGEGKRLQTQMLAELIEDEYQKGNYVIAAGDFNQSFSSTDLSNYPVISEDLWQAGALDVTAFGDHWQFLQDTGSPTCRSLDRAYDPSDENFQFYMIDGFIVSDNLTVTQMSTVDLGFEHSDHNPIKLSVTLP